MSNPIATLAARGLLQDVSDPKLAELAEGTAFYLGLDPTAPSLALGNLVSLMGALHLARAGYNAVILFGGATGSIGDPSGKNQERQLLDRATIENNVKNHQRVVGQIFARAGVSAEFVDNYEWTKNVSVLDFLRDVGKHFTVNYMIAKEVVKTRLEGDGISYTEFSYMLLQSFDFLHLYKTKNCRLQIGGSDQWGNITAGLELIRKKLSAEVFALSWPLLLNSQGKKFGKSETGGIWLDAAYSSPFKVHQFWLNVEDADVIRYIKIFTFANQSEIDRLSESLKQSPEKREAQKFLADSACTLLHGEKATADAKRSAEVLFGGALDGLSKEQLLEIFSDVPSSTISKSEVFEQTALDLFARCGLAKSKGEAKRLVSNGGAYINNQRLNEGDKKLSELLSAESDLIVLRSGKKNYHLVRLN